MNYQAETLIFGEWSFRYPMGTLTHRPSQDTQRLEPKVSELLRHLIAAEGEVISRDDLVKLLWPDVVVGDDTLARTVSRLRSALSDSARDPKFIETIPKRGYRLLVAVTPEVATPQGRGISKWLILPLVFILASGIWFWVHSQQLESLRSEKVKRADGLYMRFEQDSNEAALSLYQEVIESDPANSYALAGVANSLVQRHVRWPKAPFVLDSPNITLTNALASGQLNTKQAKAELAQARHFAHQAVEHAPENVQALKALGFVYSAQGEIENGILQYQKAIQLDDTAWRSLINLGELLELTEQSDAALQTFIKAFHAMQKSYAAESEHVGPWQPELGKVIAATYLDVGELESALDWARQVLHLVPFDREASEIVVSVLLATGDHEEAKIYCDAYPSNLNTLAACLTQELDNTKEDPNG